MFSVWSAATRSLGPAPATFDGAGWVHVSEPSPTELERLHRELHVPEAFLRHTLDRDELARVDREGESLLVLLRLPLEGKPGELPFNTHVLSVVLHGERLVTIGARSGCLERLTFDRLDPARPAAFILRLLEQLAERYLADVRAIDRCADELEAKLSDSLRNEEVLELLRYQKALVRFETALGAMELVLERLGRDARFHAREEVELLEDVGIEFRQASAMVRISAENLSQTMDAFASIISNNLNVVMKVLTSLTLVLAIPTGVASFFGMNVTLPLAGHPLAFELTLLLSFLLAVSLALFFRHRRWL